MTLTHGILICLCVFTLAMWLYERTKYKHRALFLIGMVAMIVENEMRKERDRARMRTPDPS